MKKKPKIKILGTVKKRKPAAKKKPAAPRRPRKPVLDVRSHALVPKHEKMSEKETEELLAGLQVTIKEMPRISLADPGIRHLEPKIGDVIKITRKSYTAGTAVYYRVVVDVSAESHHPEG